MEGYCRFCAERKNNLSQIFDIEEGVCNWLMEMISQEVESTNQKKNENNYLPEKVCYSCLCKIEDVNFFIKGCRKSLLRLKEIWKTNIQLNPNYIKNGNENETSSCENEKNSELEYREMSDEKYFEILGHEEIIDHSSISDENDVINDESLKDDLQFNECPKSCEPTDELADCEPHKRYLCTECGAYFNDRPTFNYHMKKHMNRNSFACDYCTKTFLTKCHLISHTWTHTGVGFKDHECKQCGKKCRTSHELEIHIRFHTQFRPYICEVCSKAFIVKTHLKQHMVTHTGERNFVCHILGCNKSYTSASSLKKHKDIHLPDSEKHISCEYCPRKFSMYFILKEHVRKSHRKLLAVS